MFPADRLDTLFVIFAFFVQVVLVVFFAARKWAFDTAMQFGWIVFALGIPAAILSVVLLIRGKPWYMWLAGFLFAAWAVFGYTVDMARPVEWRSPIMWPVFIPYVMLYLSGLVLYWWSVGFIGRQFWFAYAVLFVISTILNISSHVRR